MKHIVAALVLLTGLSFGACHRRPVVPTFDVVVADTVVARHGVSCHFQYVFASIANAERSPVLRAIQESNIHYFFGLENFSGGVREAVDRSIGRFVDEYVGDLARPETDQPEWIADLEFSVESEARVVDTLLVYTISHSSYTGGAHGMHGVNCHNYSLVGGYEISLSDLFDPDQLQGLNDAIRNKLYEQCDADGDEALAAQGFFPEYIAPTENFEVTEDGITFYYNPYDIGCYALGGVRVHLCARDLREL